MSKNIITISRQYGSGGRSAGKMVAEQLGIPFYDKELIALVAKESGFDLKFVEETAEYSTSGSFLHSMAVAAGYNRYSTLTEDTMPISDKVHIFQTKVIKEAAAKGPCVIVGRCADYILRDREDCINVFIYANDEARITRSMGYLNSDRKAAEKTMKRMDRARTTHYNLYTGQVFGDVKNYHLSIDSEKFGLEGAAKLIASCSL